MFTVTSGKDGWQPVRAWLMDGNRSRTPTLLKDNMTIRALSQGCVVRMTPRALARFQSLPDSYILPQKRGFERTIVEALADSYPDHIKQQILETYMTDSELACTIIGNGWPSLMAQKIIGPLI